MVNEIKRMQQLAGLNETFINKPLGLASDEYYLNFFQHEMGDNEYNSEQFYIAYDELRFKLFEDKYGMTREEYDIMENRNFIPLSQAVQGAPTVSRKEQRDAIDKKYNLSANDYSAYHFMTKKAGEIVDAWKTIQKLKHKKPKLKLKTKFTPSDVTQILANNRIDDNYLEENEGVISGSEEWMDVSSEITGKDAYEDVLTDKDYKIIQNFISTMKSMGIELV